MTEILWVVVCLALVFGLLFLFLYLMKRLSNGVSVLNGSRMRVLDRVTVGRDGMLLVVCVADRLMLIGVTPQRIEKICDLETTPGNMPRSFGRSRHRTVFLRCLPPR